MLGYFNVNSLNSLWHFELDYLTLLLVPVHGGSFCCFHDPPNSDMDCRSSACVRYIFACSMHPGISVCNLSWRTFCRVHRIWLWRNLRAESLAYSSHHMSWPRLSVLLAFKWRALTLRHQLSCSYLPAWLSVFILCQQQLTWLWVWHCWSPCLPTCLPDCLCDFRLVSRLHI